MKIAIIGSGISGLVAAYHLHTEHEISVFEANDYIGGHTQTVDVVLQGQSYAVDTGFIVFNDQTYPEFVGLLDELEVASQASNMSFSVHCERTGLEYNGTSLNTLFAQRSNIIRPTFYRMLLDILRFNREAPTFFDDSSSEITLREFLRTSNYSRDFMEYYIIPMGAAIWSAAPERLLDFPARFFLQFLNNHGMLSINRRPTWRVIKGGSSRYVDKLTAGFRHRIHLNCPVHSVRRATDNVELRFAHGGRAHYDQVVLACHSDQALRLLVDPMPQERWILSAIPYQENEVVLHTDKRMLPRRRRAWAAWNYHIPYASHQRVTVTYNMNILQGIDAAAPICVTLNRSERIDPRKILRKFTYHHPMYTPQSVQAKRLYHTINGVRRTFYCGAYWGYGFHEDGVKSALAMCRHMKYKLANEKLCLRRAS
jgi:predicted NAD/FAD-binding protein